MTLAALISDTHGMLPSPKDFRGADFIIHAGDVGPDRNSREWMFTDFSNWAIELGIPIYMTWGNHDFIGERLSSIVWEGLPDNVSVHVDEQIEIEGKKVWFSPWSNRFGNWAFMKEEEGLEERYAQIPADTNVIISHGPPYHLQDRILWDGKFSNVGSTSLLSRMGDLEELSLVVCGHIHQARGTSLHGNSMTVRNVSLVNERYEMLYNPTIISWS